MLFKNYELLEEFITNNQSAEQRNCEYKSSNKWEGDFKHKIVRAIICMANKKNGGSIIIGVDEDKINGNFSINGLDDEISKTYNHDELKQYVNDKYADPSIDLVVQRIKDENSNKTLINIHVSEFETIPISCKKNYKDILQSGKIYSRSFSKEECTANLSSEELREILDLAVKKGIKKEIIHLKEIGVIPSGGLNIASNQSEEDKFLQERNSF